MATLTASPKKAVQPLPWLGFGLCVLAYTFGGTASTLMATYLPVVVSQLLGNAVPPDQLDKAGAWINAVFLYGWMAGGLLFGPVADRIGRVRALAIVTALCGVGLLATASVTSLETLLLVRFVTGAGVGGVLLVSTVYISEVWPETSRPIALGILSTTFPVGIVATGGLVSGLSDWRVAFNIGLIPVVTALLIWIFLIESGVWKSGRSRPFGEKANRSGELFEPGNRANLLSGTLIFGAVLIGLWGIFGWLPTWVQTLLPVGESGQTERGVTMMLLGTGGIVGGVLSGFLVRTLGPRRTLMGTFAACIGACALLFLTNRTFSPVVYAELALLALFFGISQGSLSSYVPTLFPVSIRATATGFCFNIGRLFTATAVLFTGVLVTALGGFGNALLLFSGAFVIAFMAIWQRK
ncbi:MAG: MFS transporter [Cytophagales bacterium]|nr:MAG: MFS transporter [Cytophagales bacterium]